jgi:cob(I)alamin adenosyltransferase
VKIYTRRGDEGETDLFGGGRVSKSDLRVEAYGAVDELNACIGACVAASSQIDLGAIGRRIQGQLFDLGGTLATPDADKRARSSVPEIVAEDVAALEADIDRLESELEPLQRFILPGGTAAGAALHLARTVCRRAERRAVALHHLEPIDDAPLRYLNRLSDLLFVMARVENRREGEPDIEWAGRSG